MSADFILRESLAWSLRRFSLYRKCERAYFFRYWAPAADPLSVSADRFQFRLREKLRANPLPLHWVTQILASTLHAANEYPKCTPDILTRVCARDLAYLSRLNETERRLRILQLREASWFLLASGRLNQPLNCLPSVQVEEVKLGSIRILMLPALVFFDGELAFSMRPALPLSETDLIADTLQTLFIPFKTQRKIKEVRLRKLLFSNNRKPPVWQETLLSDEACYLGQQQIRIFAEMMHHNSLTHPYSREDFACADDPKHCLSCAFTEFCEESE